MPEQDLVKLYVCFLLSVVDFSCVVYHSILTLEQAKEIEGLQATALKIIYGFDHFYASLLEKSGLELVAERRIKMLDKFIIKTAKNEHYAKKWFLRKEFIYFDLRKELLYEEKFAKMDRLYNAPLFFIDDASTRFT